MSGYQVGPVRYQLRRIWDGIVTTVVLTGVVLGYIIGGVILLALLTVAVVAWLKAVEWLWVTL